MSEDDKLIVVTQRQRVRGGWLDFRVITATWAEARAYKLRWMKAHHEARVRGLGTDIRKFYKVGEWVYSYVSGGLTELDDFDDYCRKGR